MESLRNENFWLEKTLKRYKDMLNDPKFKNRIDKNSTLAAQGGILVHKDTILKMQEDTLSQASNSFMIDNIEEIQLRMLKYNSQSQD